MDKRAAAHSRSLLTASPAPEGAGLFLIGSARFPVPTCGRSATRVALLLAELAQRRAAAL